MRRYQWIVAGTTVVCLAVAGCGGDASPTPPASGVVSQPAPPPPATAPAATEPAATEPATAPAAAPTLRGNAATNPACKLLSIEQVTTHAGLSVLGVLGLVADTSNPAKHSESCTWLLEAKDVQSSLVVQYTLFAKPPADLKAYYPQVIKQGFGEAVPQLGDISKIQGHVLDTIDRRAEIHVSLLTHAEATAEDQAAAIAIMRLVMAGMPQ